MVSSRDGLRRAADRRWTPTGSAKGLEACRPRQELRSITGIAPGGTSGDSRSRDSNRFPPSVDRGKKTTRPPSGVRSAPASHQPRMYSLTTPAGGARPPRAFARRRGHSNSDGIERDGREAREKLPHSVIQATFVRRQSRLPCHMQILWQYNDTDQMIRVSEAWREPGKASACLIRRPAGRSFAAHEQTPEQMSPRLRRTRHSPMHDNRSETTTSRHTAVRCGARRRTLTLWI